MCIYLLYLLRSISTGIPWDGGSFTSNQSAIKPLFFVKKSFVKVSLPTNIVFLSFMLRFHSFYNFKYWIVFLLVVNSTVRRPDEWHFETSGNYAPGGVWKSKDERKWLPGNSAGSYWICQQHSIERPVCVYRFGTWNCWESTRKAMS